jgi:uncharacterized membrane protein
MPVGETLVRIGDRIPWVCERSVRTRANVGALFFVGTFVHWSFAVAWLVTCLPGALYAGIFGEDKRADMVASRGHEAPGAATETDAVDSQSLIVLGGNYAIVTVLGLFLRYNVAR